MAVRACCNARLEMFFLANSQFRTKIKQILWGWGSPVIADEADNSYRALGVGGWSLPPSLPSIQFMFLRLSAARTILPWRWRDMVRTLFSNVALAAAVFPAVAITAVFAFVVAASFELVERMLANGAATALAEYVMRSRQHPP
jgi:hypothetical protein